MRYVFGFLLITSVLVSCTSGKRALERGDYYGATVQAINRLRSNPDAGKAIQALRESYPLAVQYYKNRIDQSLNSNDPFKYTQTIEIYQDLARLSDEIQRCPAALRLFPNVGNYQEEINQAKNLATEEQYNAGLAKENIGTRQGWKEAYYCYQRTNQFTPGYKDVLKRMEDARYRATFRVIVEQIPVPRQYQLSSDFFLSQIIEGMMRYRPNEFVEFYSPESAKKTGIRQPDQLLRMSFDEFTVGQVYDKETIQDLRRDSVEVGTVNLADGKKAKAYGTVKAKLHVFHRELISNGVLDVSIFDLIKKDIAIQRKFPGQFVWSVEWGTFNGDERALTEQQYKLCQRKPVMPPSPQNLFVEFTKPIYNQATPFLKSYFQQF